MESHGSPGPVDSSPAPSRFGITAVVAFLVILAGCSGLPGVGPGPQQGESPSPGGPQHPGTASTASPSTGPASDPTHATVDAPPVNVTGGELSVDPGRVFALTGRVLGTNQTTYPDVVVLPPGEVPAVGEPPSRFFRRLGLTRTPGDVEAGAYVRGPETVYVSERLSTRPVALEYTLAHEYTHVVQHETGVYEDLLRGRFSTDAMAVRTAVLEGAAVYAADTYWRRYIRRNGRPTDDVRQAYRRSTGVTWYEVAKYRFGYRYVEARTDSPVGLPSVYAAPPRTTEAVIHTLPADTEAPVELSVNVSGESRDWFLLPSRTRMGELFVRAVLRTELSETAAAGGADGWGNDVRLAFSGENTTRRGYVWVLRWDDRKNATAFGEAFGTYLDGRARRDGDLWRNGSTAYRLERIDRRTHAVFVGGTGFVGNATANVTAGGTVRVRPPQPSTSGMANVMRRPTARTTNPMATSLVE